MASRISGTGSTTWSTRSTSARPAGFESGHEAVLGQV
jgi:hypothetical protein